MKKNRIFTIMFSIFAVIGLLLMIIAVPLFIRAHNFNQKAVKVTAVIETIERYQHYDKFDNEREIRHNVYVSYTYEGESYNDVYLGYYNSFMREGDAIDIKIDPDNPTKTGGNIDYLAPGILLGIGFIFFLIGAIALMISLIKNRNSKKLLEKGKVIYATVEEIILNPNVSINNAHPFNIICSHYDDFQDLTYRFKSDNLWTDPTSILPPGSEIKVYVNPDDYSKYYVDAKSYIEGKIMDFT